MIVNNRGQTALHLLCHNDSLRKLEVFQEMLHDILFHGANPNQTSLTGCTALHLSLYHRDVDSAIQLVNSGAELHLLWRKVRLPARALNIFSATLSLLSLHSRNAGCLFGTTWERLKSLHWTWSMTNMLSIEYWQRLISHRNGLPRGRGACTANQCWDLLPEHFIVDTAEDWYVGHAHLGFLQRSSFPSRSRFTSPLGFVWFAKEYWFRGRKTIAARRSQQLCLTMTTTMGYHFRMLEMTMIGYHFRMLHQ